MKKGSKLFVVIISVAMLSLCLLLAACAGKTEHDLEKVTPVAATCTKDGNKEYYRCKDSTCGKLFSDAEGTTEIKVADIVIPKLGHTGGTATCTEQAVCTRCEEPYGDLIDHDWSAVWLSSAAGHWHRCKNCEAVSQTVGHTPTAIGVGTPASCTESGTDAGEKCSICDYVISPAGAINPLGHSMTHNAVAAATCDDPGWNTDNYYCSRCEKYFDDADGTNELTLADIKITALGHAWGSYTSNTDGTHTRVCANNNAHTETHDCAGGAATCQNKAVCTTCGGEYGELGSHTPAATLSYTDASGHYHKCTVCDNRIDEVVPHNTSVVTTDPDDHYESCECGYTTSRVPHDVSSITAVATGGDFATDYVLTADDVVVTAICSCGRQYALTSGYTVECDPLVLGNNNVTVKYTGVDDYTFQLSVSTETKYTLTLVGATFGGTLDTYKLASGAAMPTTVKTNGKTFMGYKAGEADYYATDADFTMPMNDITLTAMYKEDLIPYAPSDKDGDGNTIGTHKTYNGIVGTELTFTAQDQIFKPRPSKDSGSTYVNVYAPAYHRTLMLIAVVNDTDTAYEILYQAENYEIKGGMTINVAANTTTVVPFVFSDPGNYHTVFEGCDHFITMKSAISGEVKLGFYGYVCPYDRLAIQSISATAEKTFYESGESIDLSGIHAEAMIGESNFKVKLAGFDSSVADGTPWTESIDQIVISFGGQQDVIKLNCLDDWVAVSLSKNFDSNSWLSARYVPVEGTTMTATELTFKAGGTTGNDVAAWPNNDYNNPNSQGYNVRVPNYANRARALRWYVTNMGDNPISFRLYAEDYGDRGGADITLAAGESKIVTFNVVNNKNTVGCNYKIKLLSDVSVDTKVVLYGYFHTYTGEVSGLSINSASSHRTTFSVGDTFSAQKLAVDIVHGNDYDGTSDDANITNFTTDLDGHEFTAADVGTKTVTVSWNGLTVTYDITVNAAS